LTEDLQKLCKSSWSYY